MTIPPWKVFKQSLGLDVKEPAETFDWLTDPDTRKDYNAFRDGLNTIPGSREWLKDYTCPDGESPFVNPMGHRIMPVVGSWHSGSSCVQMGWRYKNLLNDWDAFVLRNKTAVGKALYKSKQMPMGEVLTRHLKDPSDKMLAEIYEEYCADNLAKIEADEKERFEDCIVALEHHLKFPSRWFDNATGSSLIGNPRYITEETFKVMEVAHPGYRAHIQRVINLQDKAWLRDGSRVNIIDGVDVATCIKNTL